MRQVNVVLLRGLAGNYYSTGLDGLALRLKHIPGVDYVATAGYGSWQVWANQIRGWKDPTILIGHSFGANAVVKMARELPVKIPLLVSFDASPWWSWTLFQAGPGAVPVNVTRVLNFYQRNSALIRGVELRRADNTALNILNEPVNSTHTEIEDDAALHARAVAEVQKIINA